MKIVDLSHSLVDSGPTYPSDPELIIKKEKDIKNNRSLLHSISFGTHTGTHLDTPAHMISEGKTLDKFSLDKFIGLAVKVNSDNYKSLLTLKKNFDSVIFDTGWYKNYKKPNIFFGKNRPVIPDELISIVVNKKIKIFGCDLPSVDESGKSEKKVHSALLNDEIIIYEALNNLNELPFLLPFKFFGLPLPLHGVDGSPTRSIGIIDNG